jgi:hypothetical protein
VADDVEQRFGVEAQAGLLVRFAQRRVDRRLARVDAALRQVPVALAGDVAEQQLARVEQHDDAAAEAWGREGRKRAPRIVGGLARTARRPAASRPGRQLR